MKNLIFFFFLLFFRKLKEKPEKVLATFFKSSIEHSLLKIFGEIGGLTTIDLLKFDENRTRGILRVPEDFYVKLRSSLTLINKFQDISCYFKVNSASPVLLSLLDSFCEF